MWQKAQIDSTDRSTAMSSFVKASAWLSDMLKNDELAIVPTSSVFKVLNPELSTKLIDYQSIWDSAGVKMHERFSKEKLRELQNHFINFLKENPHARYLVLDWVDPYAKYLFEKNDELLTFLKEVKVIPFTLSTGWSNKIVIYEQVRYTPLLVIDLTCPSPRFFTLPNDTTADFSSDGVTISKEHSQVGFYLSLEEGIDSSRQNYLTMNTTFNVDNLTLTIVFYYDKNRDGIFNEYASTDYIKSIILSQTDYGWTSYNPYRIYKIIPNGTDPIVQIGIILSGDENGTIILHNIIVYSEITS